MAQLLALTIAMLDHARAVAIARRTLGDDALAATVPYLQEAALPRGIRNVLEDQHVELGVVDRHQADHALVDVGAGVAVNVVVEPQERLLLAVVVAGGMTEVEVVQPLAGLVGGLVRLAPERAEAPVGVVGVAVGLRRGVAVVQVGQERVVGRAEVRAVVPLSWSRWFSKRTSTGRVYSALIIGPGNCPLKP